MVIHSAALHQELRFAAAGKVGAILEPECAEFGDRAIRVRPDDVAILRMDAAPKSFSSTRFAIWIHFHDPEGAFGPRASARQ